MANMTSSIPCGMDYDAEGPCKRAAELRVIFKNDQFKEWEFVCKPCYQRQTQMIEKAHLLPSYLDLLVFVEDFHNWMEPVCDVNKETENMVGRAAGLLGKEQPFAQEKKKAKPVAKKGTGEFVMYLESQGNPDFGQFAPVSDPLWVRGKNLKAMVKACEEYIAYWNLGGGNWVDPVVKRNGKKIAYISYNRRVWDITRTGGKPNEITVLS